jgi:excisionase family DNA binding protein
MWGFRKLRLPAECPCLRQPALSKRRSYPLDTSALPHAEMRRMRRRDSSNTMRPVATDLLTIQEAVRALGISRSTLWRRLRRGEIPSVRRSGRRLVRVTSVGKAAQGKAEGDIPPLTENHPIFRLTGAGRSGGQLPGARDKHAVLDTRTFGGASCGIRAQFSRC